MDLFLEADYRQIIKTLFRAKPQLGHGQTTRLAKHLGVNTTLVSQILSGKRNFTEDQAAATAQFLNLNQKETYYFLLLVQKERAASPALKTIYDQQIQKTQVEAKDLKGRVSTRKDLSFEQQAIYYSNWTYAAVHTLASIEGFKDRSSIARKLGLEEVMTQNVLDRLIEYGLVKEERGTLGAGATSTYLAPDSPLVIRHHQTWRQMATQKMTSKTPEDFYFTAPFSISRKDLESFRKKLTELVADLYSTVEKTKPQEIVCLNMDLFKVS